MSRALPPHWAQASDVVNKVSRIAYQSALPKKTPPRLGRKGFLYLQKTAPTQVKPAEKVRIVARRMLKAERDERMDITQALTVVKQYMAGFTRPRDLRSSNWFPGGAYISRQKSYESPAEEAYQPHTVFLLESRYNVVYGVGRQDSPEYIYGVCREQDLSDVLSDLNSPRADRDALEAMDNARWPEGPQLKPHKQEQWWIDQRDYSDTMREMGLTDRLHQKVAQLHRANDEDGGEGEVKKSTEKFPRVAALNPVSPPTKARFIRDSSSSASRGSVRVLHSSSVLLSAVRVSNGTVAHPSGFEPPMPADEFEHSESSTVDSRIGQQPLVPPGKRRFHTTASQRAEEVQWDFARVREEAAQAGNQFLSREEYLPTLAAKPFWRPLITVTLATRPLAQSVVRLAKGLPTGRPYHADIHNDDKKCRISIKHRMRGMRINRIQNLAIETAQKLAGMRGGFIGLRFDNDSLGRGIGGEGLANPIPAEKRVIDVGVANWYRLADETKETFRLRAAEEVFAPKPFKLWGLDDFGRRLDESGEVVPWGQNTTEPTYKIIREVWYKEFSCLVKALDEYRAYAKSKSPLITQMPKHAPVVLKRPSREENVLEDDDEDDEDEEEDDEDEDENVGDSTAGTPQKSPSVFTRSGEHVAALQARVNDLDIDLKDPNSLPPLDFVVCSGNGRPLLGPVVDEAGAISMEGFTHELPAALARAVVAQRHTMYCLSRTTQIAEILAARGTKISYPRSGWFVTLARLKKGV